MLGLAALADSVALVQRMAVPLTMLVMSVQLLPPSTEPYRTSPVLSAALRLAMMVCAAVAVIRSSELLPVSEPRLTPLTVSTGAVVSRVKIAALALLALPAESMAKALTLIIPSPSVARSFATSVMTCALPVPIMDLVTVPPSLPEKVSTTMASLSALTVTTPLAAMASVPLAPSMIPLTKANSGVLGAMVSLLTGSTMSAIALTASLLCRA